MTFAMSERIGISRQRGFWLRCFLGRAFLLMSLCSAISGVLHAQLDMPSPIRLTHVTGYVINRSGKPVANVEVTLSQDDVVIYRTRTDQSGAFKFDRVSGKYTFRVARSEDAPAAHEIVVTPEIVTALKRKKLYVILGPGACADECSTVTTSKHEFDQVIRKKTRE